MFFGIAFLILGVGIILQKMGYLPTDLDLFWAIIFIAFGLTMIFGRRKFGHWRWDDCMHWWFGEKRKEKK